MDVKEVGNSCVFSMDSLDATKLCKGRVWMLLLTVLSLIFKSVSQWEGWDVSCALVPDQVNTVSQLDVSFTSFPGVREISVILL